MINVTIREEEATEADSCDPISIPLCDDETVFSCPATMDEAIALGACTQTDKSHQIHTWLEPSVATVIGRDPSLHLAQGDTEVQCVTSPC